MRDCLAVCRTTPDKKMRDIEQVVSLLMQQQVFADMNISMQSNPIDMTNQTILAEPQIFKQNQIIHVNENVLRNLAVQVPINLLRDEWIMVYQAPK